MDERQLSSFLQYVEVLQFLPNAIIFRKGDHGDAMFLVLQGEVRARNLVGGRESTLSTLGVGECFGELAVLDEGARSADVVANVETVLLKISAEALKRLFQEAPSLGGAVPARLEQDHLFQCPKADQTLRGLHPVCQDREQQIEGCSAASLGTVPPLRWALGPHAGWVQGASLALQGREGSGGGLPERAVASAAVCLEEYAGLIS